MKKYTKEQFKTQIMVLNMCRPVVEASLSALRDEAAAIEEHDPLLAALMHQQAQATQDLYDHVRRRTESN